VGTPAASTSPSLRQSMATPVAVESWRQTGTSEHRAQSGGSTSRSVGCQMGTP
jgi:hypothetical protein